MTSLQTSVASTEVGPLLETVVRSAPNGIIVVDDRGKIVLANGKAEELFGYEKGELLHLNVEQLLPAGKRKKHLSQRKEYFHEPETRLMGLGRDLFACRKNGDEFPVEVGLSPIESSGGAMAVATVIDITERKLAEAELLRHSEILDNVHDAVFLADSDGVIKSWNTGAEEVYGFRAEEAIGSNVRIFLPEDDQERYVSRTYPTILEKGRYDFVSWSLHKGGRRIAVSVRAKLLYSASGEPEGAVICATDITQQKLLEQKVIEVSENEQRRIGQDIHDDLCQQLASIGCLTKVLEQRLQESYQEEAEHLSQIGDMITQANVRAREIARNLVPSVVESED